MNGSHVRHPETFRAGSSLSTGKESSRFLRSWAEFGQAHGRIGVRWWPGRQVIHVKPDRAPKRKGPTLTRRPLHIRCSDLRPTSGRRP
ncbi:hypothetical protein [Devosia sp. DBB001]|nr:hypothetical protein [Devosia sp. DBB001]